MKLEFPWADSVAFSALLLTQTYFGLAIIFRYNLVLNQTDETFTMLEKATERQAPLQPHHSSSFHSAFKQVSTVLSAIQLVLISCQMYAALSRSLMQRAAMHAALTAVLVSALHYSLAYFYKAESLFYMTQLSSKDDLT